MMKERPIIFSTESVRAILEGRKTQTRRVMNPQPDIPSDYKFKHGYDDGGAYFEHIFPTSTIKYYGIPFRCPFGAPGDRLWVREKWCYLEESDTKWYRADISDDEMWAYDGFEWKSPMFMPRKFSRLTLEIVNVSCERIKSISAGDCLAEGYESIGKYIDEWDRLNAKRGFSWDINPWVWVIEFKRIENGGQQGAKKRGEMT